MNRKPTPSLTRLLLVLLLAGGVVPLQAVGPASSNPPRKSKASTPKPAVETVAPVVKDKEAETSPKPESATKPEIMPDDQAPEPAPKRKDRGGLISALKARKQEREKKKAEQEASATPQNPSAPSTAAKPREIEDAEPEKAGFFARVFKKRPRKQSVEDAPGETGKPEMPEVESPTSRDKKAETEAPIPKVRPKRRGFDPPWSQKKDVPESAEAPTAETDVTPGKKTKKRGLRLPWSQKKDAPESAEAPPAETYTSSEKRTKRRGFRWPWSQRKEAPVSEDSSAGEVEAPLPPPTVDPISLIDIKPREPETALAPSAAPTPPGKKPNPLDDIGLHPER